MHSNVCIDKQDMKGESPEPVALQTTDDDLASSLGLAHWRFNHNSCGLP